MWCWPVWVRYLFGEFIYFSHAPSIYVCLCRFLCVSSHKMSSFIIHRMTCPWLDRKRSRAQVIDLTHSVIDGRLRVFSCWWCCFDCSCCRCWYCASLSVVKVNLPRNGCSCSFGYWQLQCKKGMEKDGGKCSHQLMDGGSYARYSDWQCRSAIAAHILLNSQKVIVLYVYDGHAFSDENSPASVWKMICLPP